MKFKVGNRQPLIPPGEYDAIVANIEEDSFINKRKGLVFTFSVASGKFRDTELRGFVNANYESFSEHTKLYKWYVAALGDVLEPNSDFSTDDFFNRVLKVQVETKKSRKTGNEFSNVTSILGAKCEL